MNAIPNEKELYITPNTKYFKEKEAFNAEIAKDFIKYVNEVTKKGNKCLVGLAHGQSPAGAYEYILKNYSLIKYPERVVYTFTNSRLRSQRNLEGVTDSRPFIISLLKKGYISKEQIIGGGFKRDEDIESYTIGYNKKLQKFLDENNKDGYDFVFMASDPIGRVAAITRKSTAFTSSEIMTVVNDRTEKEVTATPYFILKSKKIAFLATKADKRRALAWLYSRVGKDNESPSFIRHIPDIQDRLTVYIDDKALTWPQVEIVRKSKYGDSVIRLDVAKPYNENAKNKLPVIILIHGFLGLNSFDGLLTTIPTSKYIAAAMHYGSIPNDLPPAEYSEHVAANIDTVVGYFGAKGHPVYIFDHSMGNTYFLLIDKYLHQYKNYKKYVKGRIGANPFFGDEAKHALKGFLDYVILPSLTISKNFVELPFFVLTRETIPIDTKHGVRNKGIFLTKRLITNDTKVSDRIWTAIKRRILDVMSGIDSFPALNRIPIENALNKIPAKIFAIQIYSCLISSKQFDKQQGLNQTAKAGIPVLIIKSRHDGIAKFVPRLYQSKNVTIVDVTDEHEDDFFREHLYHMKQPMATTKMIEDFIKLVEMNEQ
ncbi:MAG: 6-phosphogluconolactonase [Chitinophagales bacterium]|nr:6-phosphogluconolactonase [Chitinophagales bacterium]